MLLVGPGGVFVLDVKNWRTAPETSGGRLSAGGEDREEHVRKLLAMSRTAEGAVASLGLSPVAVQPMMVFAGRLVDATLGLVRLLGEHEVGPVLIKEPRRLRPEAVRVIADLLERAFPEYEASTVAKPEEPRPPAKPTGGDDGLFDVDGLRDAALEEAMRAPIEQWMTFLHPDQVALVRRNWSGPARISGPAGTGKKCGRPRAAYLAQRTTGRILYVTFANNLPRVQSTFLQTMSPAVAAHFRSLHQWAQDFLRERGVEARLHGDKAETAFSLTWKHTGRGSLLAEIDPAPGYWREEIDHVI